MIRHLIWDLDGTLLDTYPAIVFAVRSALRDLGVDAAEAEVDALCKVSYSHCLHTLSEEHGVPSDLLRSKLEAHQRSASLSGQPPFPGVRSLCGYVRSIGGANYILTHRQRDSVLALLEAHGMGGWFVDVVAGDDGFPRKPDPAGLVDLMARRRIPRSEALLIGDRDLDVATASAAGIRGCFYGTNARSEPTTYAVTDYQELLDILIKENRAC